ncbi:hypothetical protein DMC30DRAFT_405768 [Rhodotorula diobovata]|uniref:Uncharacterized protein n=1 Tax=Rhodotorula diobovata TaxID=5288 RepID=A0A5C5FKR8_9BASI|nr:hypothetical protein DMC30DRAFT_405768 [Rhodotorula diobovata]
MPRTRTGQAPDPRENKYTRYECFGHNGEVYCFCDGPPRLEAVLKTTLTNRIGNEGRCAFFLASRARVTRSQLTSLHTLTASCSDPLEDCRFFLWEYEVEDYGAGAVGQAAGRRFDESTDDDEDEGAATDEEDGSPPRTTSTLTANTSRHCPANSGCARRQRPATSVPRPRRRRKATRRLARANPDGPTSTSSERNFSPSSGRMPSSRRK